MSNGPDGSDSTADDLQVHAVLPDTVYRINPDGTTTRVSVTSLDEGDTFTLDQGAPDLVAETGSPPIPTAVVWLEGDASPFGIAVLDLRAVTWTSTATTGDPAIAERFRTTRGASEEELGDLHPAAALITGCDLWYPAIPELADGPMFTASVMEEKWDVFLSAGQIRALRSWTGESIFVARTQPAAAAGAPVHVDQLEYGGAMSSEDALFEFDFVMKAYVYGQIVPYRCPAADAEREPHDVALAAFSRHGQRAAYATFQDVPLGWPDALPDGDY